jgi:glycosyltransferase involved in cell wall biosynthesis
VRDKKHTAFYFFDLRDAWSTILLSRNIFTEIHMYYKSSLDFINRWGLDGNSGLIVATGPMLNDIRAEYKVPDDKLLHAPCAVNYERFGIATSKEEARRELGLPQNEKLIFYIGHLFPVKGVDVLFDVHTMLEPGETIYFIGGTDEDIMRFKEKWHAAGEPKNIVIAGRKPHQEMPLWMRAADVLSIPNTAKDPAGSIESSPSKLIEYMASGRPIVASDVPAIRDVLDDTMGYFAEPDSATSIADAIKRIFADEALAEEKSRNAQEAAKGLSWDARAKKILNFIGVRSRGTLHI